MSFKSTSPLATNSIRIRTDEPQLIRTARSLRESQILLMLIFNITLSQCHMLIQWRRNVLISTGNGSCFSTLTINLLHMRFDVERFVGEFVSIWRSNFVRVKNDISWAWEHNICYDAQNKLYHFPPVDYRFPKQNKEKWYGRFPWAHFNVVRFKCISNSDVTSVAFQLSNEMFVPFLNSLNAVCVFIEIAYYTSKQQMTLQSG